MDNTIKELKQEIEQLKRDNKKLKERKKYGIVWEEEKEPEQVVLECKEKVPILKDVKDKEILTDEEKPMNLLIEGDNYHALQVLNYTHKGKIDVIYIDPPYNTGKKDEWKYNDKFVDKEDSYRHSKWLNFISKRIRLAKELLSTKGIIFISIDDNEQAQLKILCDEIFDEDNFIALLPTIINLKGNNDQFGFSGTHEYALVYCKDKGACSFNQFKIEEEKIFKNWGEDEKGYFKQGAPLKATGTEASREDRPNMFYPVLYHPEREEVDLITDEEYKGIYNNESKEFNDKFLEKLQEKYEAKGYEFILPKIHDNYGRWRWGWNSHNKERLRNELIVSTGGQSTSFYKKQRPKLGDLPTKKPKSIFYKPEYSSGTGTAHLRDIFHSKVFDNPKPVDLIKDFLELSTDKESVVLDFFAGTGTTGDAILRLNKEDNGNRTFILATNNEDNNKSGGGICTDICHPRIKKIITGYKNRKGKKVEGLGGNLKYFKTDFIDVGSVYNIFDEKKIELTHKAGEMIAIREDVFEEVEKNEWWQIFKGKDKQVAIYFREDQEKLEELFEKLKNDKSIVYLFSWGKNELKASEYGYDNITIKDIPQPIIDVYKEINRL